MCPACGKSHRPVCSSCGSTISSRQHIISDFLIGANVIHQADKLVTRDRGFYRKFFKELDIVTPQ